MPKLNNTTREQIAPFLLSMLERGLSLREIRETLSGIKPLTHEAIRLILDTYYRGRYTEIMKGRGSIKNIKKQTYGKRI